MNREMKVLGKLICFLLIWNFALSCFLVAGHFEKKTEQLNQQICNLEAIPDEVPTLELVEVE